VDSIASLKSKVHGAVAGDVITVKNGTYTTTGTITVRAAGAADRPITITAETVGGVEITGTHGFNVVEPALHVIIAGFVFTHAAGKATVAAGTSHVRFTRNSFNCPGDGAYLSVLGDDAQVDFNEFGEKKTSGSMLAVGGTGSQVARRIWVHHNYFHDFASGGAASAEMIRLGLSALSQSVGAALVEHNLFVHCRGENELISSRSSGNIFRYNTFLDSPSSQLTLRHGNECEVYGNHLRNTEGLRVFGDRHQIYSNSLQGNYIGINLGNGSTEGPGEAAASGHDRPDGCVIAFNTLVDNRTHYQMSRRTPNALGATNTTFANNLLFGGAIAAKIEGPYLGPIWSGNILWNVPSAGDLPSAGFKQADPMLEVGDDGVPRLHAESPLVGTAIGEFPVVLLDIDGQPRSDKKSVGADEVGEAPIVARVLGIEDVGPTARTTAAAP
jgi:hypothetical protein